MEETLSDILFQKDTGVHEVQFPERGEAYFANKKQPRIVRMKEVIHRTGLSRSTIYLRMKSSEFPRSFTLGSDYAMGWLESDIDAWIEKTAQGAKG